MASLSNLLLITEDQEDGKQAPYASQHNSPCGIKQCLERCWKYQQPSVAAFGLVFSAIAFISWSDKQQMRYIRCGCYSENILSKQGKIYSEQLWVKKMMFIMWACMQACVHAMPCVHACVCVCVCVCVYMQVLQKPITHGICPLLTNIKVWLVFSKKCAGLFLSWKILSFEFSLKFRHPFSDIWTHWIDCYSLAEKTKAD